MVAPPARGSRPRGPSTFLRQPTPPLKDALAATCPQRPGSRFVLRPVQRLARRCMRQCRALLLRPLVRLAQLGVALLPVGRSRGRPCCSRPHCSRGSTQRRRRWSRPQQPWPRHAGAPLRARSRTTGPTRWPLQTAEPMDWAVLQARRRLPAGVPSWQHRRCPWPRRELCLALSGPRPPALPGSGLSSSRTPARLRASPAQLGASRAADRPPRRSSQRRSGSPRPSPFAKPPAPSWWSAAGRSPAPSWSAVCCAGLGRTQRARPRGRPCFGETSQPWCGRPRRCLRPRARLPSRWVWRPRARTAWAAERRLSGLPQQRLPQSCLPASWLPWALWRWSWARWRWPRSFKSSPRNWSPCTARSAPPSCCSGSLRPTKSALLWSRTCLKARHAWGPWRPTCPTAGAATSRTGQPACPRFTSPRAARS
mmetsp:Transcript_4723/g.20187  ORF Transcript_4723/g.20187 Transcript_4723/m.20187 type:complete len:424 (-) Transcript_4723:3189-4460(-)